jgi:hypothetical protein
VLEQLLDHLQAAGLGVKGTTLFANLLPDTPHALVALLPYPGEAGGWRDDQGLPADDAPRFQVNVRDPSETTATTLAKQVHAALHVRQRAIGGTWFMAIEPLQSPFLLKRDESDRAVVVFNVRAWLRA